MRRPRNRRMLHLCCRIRALKRCDSQRRDRSQRRADRTVPAASRTEAVEAGGVRRTTRPVKPKRIRWGGGRLARHHASEVDRVSRQSDDELRLHVGAVVHPTSCGGRIGPRRRGRDYLDMARRTIKGVPEEAPGDRVRAAGTVLEGAGAGGCSRRAEIDPRIGCY